MKLHKYQKGLARLIVIIVVLVLAGVAGGAYYFGKEHSLRRDFRYSKLSSKISTLLDDNKCPNEATVSTEPYFKVAFIGDQGLSSNSKKALQLIKKEGADMVLHQGDFDYQDDPEKWDEQINDILGDDFPYFASIGNHEVEKWEDYQEKLQTRLDRINGESCIGDLGVKSACTYQGLFFVLSGVGTIGSDHVKFLSDQFECNKHVWRICSWHKNQRLMQVGNKKDEVGWEPYEECRKGGALIATAHNHGYSRTFSIENFENQSIVSTSDTLSIEKGKTFAFVSGLAGASIHPQIDQLAANDWWAAVYDGNFGALFCTFNEKDIENKAHCYFKDIDANTIDEFSIVNKLGGE